MKLSSSPLARVVGRRFSVILFLAGLLFTFGIELAACGPSGATPTTVQQVLQNAAPSPSPTPKSTRGRVVDEFTGRPVFGAEVHMAGVTTVTSEDGQFVFDVIAASQVISVAHPGYVPAQVAADSTGELRLRPAQAVATILDERTGRPLRGARVYYQGGIITSATDGRVTIPAPEPGTPVEIMLAGYRKSTVRLGRSASLEWKIEPFDVRALYLTHYTMGWDERREQLFGLVEHSELNAVVIDVKGDRGTISYRTEVPLAKAIGAQEVMIDDVEGLLRRLKAANVYTIARIVVFKDDVLASKHPEYQVKLTNGQPYVDFEDLKWVDPFRQEVWEYNIQIAEEAVRKGFDEIQFDYVRYPSDGVGGNVYSQSSTESSRVGAITGFVKAANERVRKLGAFVAIDTFGWTMFMPDDIGIGQQTESLAPYVDFICPMVYPSGWDPGSAGIEDPVSQPYDIVKASTRRGIERTADFRSVRIRPWIQDFNDYGPSQKKYGEAEVRAQIRATRDAGAPGFMLWDAAATYTATALESAQDAPPPTIDGRLTLTTTHGITSTTGITVGAAMTPTRPATTSQPTANPGRPPAAGVAGSGA